MLFVIIRYMWNELNYIHSVVMFSRYVWTCDWNMFGLWFEVDLQHLLSRHLSCKHGSIFPASTTTSKLIWPSEHLTSVSSPLFSPFSWDSAVCWVSVCWVSVCWVSASSLATRSGCAFGESKQPWHLHHNPLSIPTGNLIFSVGVWVASSKDFSIAKDHEAILRAVVPFSHWV